MYLYQMKPIKNIIKEEIEGMDFKLDNDPIHIYEKENFFPLATNVSLVTEKKKKKPMTMKYPIGKIFSIGGAFNENELPKSHIMTREEFNKIVQEEIIKLNETPEILTINDLAEIGARTGNDFDILLQIFQDAYRSGGDEEVIELAKSMTGQNLYALSKGKYTFSPVTGGGLLK